MKSIKEVKNEKQAKATRSAAEDASTQNELANLEGAAGKTPLPLKIFGILCFLGGASLLTEAGFIAGLILVAFRRGFFTSETVVTQVIYAVFGICLLATVVCFIVFGIRLLRNRRRGARQLSEALIALMVADIMCIVMLHGMSGYLVTPLVVLAALVVLQSYIDPTLSEERELQRKLRNMELREDVEEGTLGRDETGKGYIRLDFFNLFWIFVVCCVLGIIIETMYILVMTGAYQNRTGMLWGPFSPIYGLGAVLMTIALNRFHDRNLLIIFLVSAVIGGAFEYCVSWFLEFAFGVTAWDYTGTFLSIDGRTNGFYMCMWGLLGSFWIKLCLPRMLKLVNLIPWKWRYSVTTVCAALMLLDAGMTLVTLDCWYERLAGLEPDNAITEFCAEHYDNDWMQNHFQTMTVNPDNAARAQ